MKLAIAIPTYNEAPNLEILVPQIKSELEKYKDVVCTVFIIDDNSPDGTAKVAERIGRQTETSKFSVTVFNRTKKEGLGAAYVYGFNKILKQDFDFIIQMDADLSHNPHYLPKFLNKAKTADFVIGSRYIKGGGTQDWGLLRQALSVGGNLYARLLLSTRVTDYTGGFNLYSTALLKTVDLKTLEATGYGFLIQLKYRALKHCHDEAEVPIMFKDRQHGKSKLPKSTIIKSLILVITLRLKTK